jgi:hypothetical protein
MQLRSSAACLPSLVVLELNADSGAGLEAGEERADIAFFNSEDKGLLAPLIILVSDRQEVATRFAEQENRGDDGRKDNAAAGVLAIFEKIDAVVGNAERTILAGEHHDGLILGMNASIFAGLELLDGAADVLGVTPGLAGRQKDGYDE